MMSPDPNYVPLTDSTVDLLLDQIFNNVGSVEMRRAERIAKDRAHYKALSEAQAATIAAREAFKAYVHRRLDEAGIDPHEEQNALNGCRIGARLDDVFRYEREQAAELSRAICAQQEKDTAIAKLEAENEALRTTLREIWLSTPIAYPTTEEGARALGRILKGISDTAEKALNPAP